jgi:hypothetical protein
MPIGIYKRPTTMELFLSKIVIRENGCWEWIGTVETNGYGRFHKGGFPPKQISAHRLSYELFKGEIPRGFDIDHTCHNKDIDCKGGYSCIHRRCVNPNHLEVVSCKENIHRGKGLCANNIRKTHCPQGHPYDVKNTYICKNGHRDCRECARLKMLMKRQERLGHASVQITLDRYSHMMPAIEEEAIENIDEI